MKCREESYPVLDARVVRVSRHAKDYIRGVFEYLKKRCCEEERQCALHHPGAVPGVRHRGSILIFRDFMRSDSEAAYSNIWKVNPDIRKCFTRSGSSGTIICSEKRRIIRRRPGT